MIQSRRRGSVQPKTKPTGKKEKNPLTSHTVVFFMAHHPSSGSRSMIRKSFLLPTDSRADGRMDGCLSLPVIIILCHGGEACSPGRATDKTQEIAPTTPGASQKAREHIIIISVHFPFCPVDSKIHF
jgi:hypothetical protein